MTLLLSTLPMFGQPSDEVINVVYGWEYRRGDSPVGSDGIPLWTGDTDPAAWTGQEAPVKPLRTLDEPFLWQRVPIPAGPWKVEEESSETQRSLFLNGPFLYFDLYVDDALVYRYWGSPAEQAGGTPWHVVPLPADAEGKYLFIRSYSPYRYIGVHGTPFIGREVAVVRRIVRDDVVRIIITVLSFVAATVGLALFLFRSYRAEYGGFVVFAFAMGVYVLRYTRVKQLLTGPTPVWNYLWILALVFMPVGLITFLRALFTGRFGRTFSAMRTVHLGSIIPALVLIYMAPFGAGDIALTVVRSMYVLSMFILTAIALRIAVSGDRDGTVIAGALVALIVFGLYDVAIAFGIVGGTRPVAHIGMFLFLVALSYLLGRRIAETYDATERYAGEVRRMMYERNRFVDELHDGIGSLMTNIGLLSDVARRRDDSAPPVLAKVSDLARVGLDEIRLFMRSLDEAEHDWHTVAAELRQFANTTIGGPGIAFAMDVIITENHPPVTAVTYMTVNRAFRELITNIAKHARASRAQAKLIVTSSAVTLTITDDGVGYGNETPETDGGHGIPAMFRRIRGLGGSMHIENQEGTKITIEVPINAERPDYTHIG